MHYLWKANDLGSIWIQKDALLQFLRRRLPLGYECEDVSFVAEEGRLYLFLTRPDSDLRQVEALAADLERDLKRIGFSSVRVGWALKEEVPSLPEPGRLYMHPLFWAVLASAIVAFVQLGFWRSLTVCIGGFAGYGVAHFVVARDKTSPSNPLRCRRR